MDAQKGKIGVTAENIFPIIKKFLYSEQEIFLRELVSNAVDATQKAKTLARTGELEGELGDLTIRVSIDKENKTITISDSGIGMDAEEVDKYINQIAFTGANDFLDKYKDKIDAIIGHFGLGFYSAFMVAEKVELVTKSYKKDSKAVRWICDGSPEFSLEDAEKETRGTDVILHVGEDDKEFLEDSRIQGLLDRYCRFLPIPIGFGKEKEYKDGKQLETEKDIIINDTEPIWKKKPTELKDEDYKEFYKKLYPQSFEDPLFHIHLNVDFPFNLTGILYFPKIRTNLEVQKNKINLYSNQVFVTDSVENIVPEFLTLLHGVLDSPDIPLNVSRSYLQSDSNVRKISSHITKKVADKLAEIFKNQRDEFEKKWDDLKLFIEYGMLSDDKFFEKAKGFFLYKNVDAKCFSVEEYEKLIKENQTDKDGKVIYLYATNKIEQFKFIEDAKDRGYDVVMFDGPFDIPFINMFETKLENSRFARVDSDTIDNLIRKDDKKEISIPKEDQDDLTLAYETAAPESVGTYFVQFSELGEKELPVVITQSEYMRRMKDIGLMGGPEVSLYNNLPDNYNLVINATHPLTKQVIEGKKTDLGKNLEELRGKVSKVNVELDALKELTKDKKEEEISQEEKDKKEDLEKERSGYEDEIRKIVKEWAVTNNLVKQVIDLALLAKNLLKGEALMNFVRRSVDFIEK
ncbi:MAG: molecular chaperone HtpG [Bacteroidales bacterium]|nr:molecular chaperone HtpG [Bacteroidales bacterium]